MKKVLLLYLLLVGIIVIACGGLYLWFTNIDFVGKTAKQVEESRNRMRAIRLRAEYRDLYLHYKINLLDSVNAEVMAGNHKHDLIVFKNYRINNDTILFKALSNEVKEDADLEQYLDVEKAVIKDSLLFLLDSTGNLLPHPMCIKINKLY